MIQFKQLNTRLEFRLSKIIKFFMQATPNIATGDLYVLHTNDLGQSTESSELGILLGNGDNVSLSTYVYEVIPNKIVHYSQYEFKWVNGEPVLRTTPLLNNPSVRQELQDAFTAINTTPKSLIDYWYLRIEQVFNVDLDTY